MNYLIIINGLPATGKTTIAKKLAAQLELPLLCKDDFKERLGELLEVKSVEDSKKLGAAAFAMQYLAMELILQANKPCMMEGNFSRKFDVDKLSTIAEKYGVRVVEVYCECDEEIRQERYSNRNSSGQRHPVHLDNQRELRPKTPDTEALNIQGEAFHFNTNTEQPEILEEALNWIKQSLTKPLMPNDPLKNFA